MPKIRPEIPNLMKPNSTEVESFQNAVLRPIIKMQHPLLVASFNSYLLNKKIQLKSASDAKIRSHIKSIFTKDISYKNFIVGCIVGHFSVDEFVIYDTISSEINRRITQIIIQRMYDSLEALQI